MLRVTSGLQHGCDKSHPTAPLSCGDRLLPEADLDTCGDLEVRSTWVGQVLIITPRGKPAPASSTPGFSFLLKPPNHCDSFWDLEGSVGDSKDATQVALCSGTEPIARGRAVPQTPRAPLSMSCKPLITPIIAQPTPFSWDLLEWLRTWPLRLAGPALTVTTRRQLQNLGQGSSPAWGLTPSTLHKLRWGNTRQGPTAREVAASCCGKAAGAPTRPPWMPLSRGGPARCCPLHCSPPCLNDSPTW